MTKLSKRMKQVKEKIDSKKEYTIDDAVKFLKEDVAHPKFDESFEISINLNVDPKNSQQMVRGTVVLPNGTGKKIRILVFCKGEAEAAAREAGADFFGSDDLLAKVAGGFLDFDAVIATPEMMKDVGKLGKVLGPRGLMPNPKLGTVTNDIKKAVEDLKSGKIEFKMDKLANINCAVGKVSFEAEKLSQNISALISAITAAKPTGIKGFFIKGMALSTTMGPGLRLECPK